MSSLLSLSCTERTKQMDKNRNKRRETELTVDACGYTWEGLRKEREREMEKTISMITQIKTKVIPL